jgi:hypothetical protein
MSNQQDTTSAPNCKSTDLVPSLLHAIADEITNHCADLNAKKENKLEKTIRVCELLMFVKHELPHRQFRSWVTDNVPFGPRQAAKYMYVYIHQAHAREAANKNRWFSFTSLNKMVAALRDWLDVHNVKKNRPRGRGKKGDRLAAKLFMDAADPKDRRFASTATRQHAIRSGNIIS